jgi:hypothetical protein
VRSLVRFVLVVCVASVATLSTPALSAPTPERSGTIIGGWYPGLAYLAPSPRGCRVTSECLVWWASGCSPELAGRNPGLHDSIVDVRGLGRRARAYDFVVRRVGPTSAVPLPKGGLTVEMWTAECKALGEVGTYRGGSQGILDRDRFRIPTNAAWMTVASSDNTKVEWALYRAGR